ncbi:MAG: AAA family ATPase [Kiritimatiellae bacterium]|jgi:predicted AAA+ superfamily ATPase|nr:AAA family ATPase [Kiritimatiellia bacterium]
MKTKRRYIKELKGSFFLFGARGTGKSTWLQELNGDALVLDLLNPELHRRFSARPERLIHWLDANRKAEYVVIDEIQRVPELLSVVHQKIESDNMRFVLTGSSARKLKRSGIDLLAGRAGISIVNPFMASELGKDFLFKKALKFGMIPLVYAAKEPEETLAGYVSLYLREEILAEGIVRNIGNFSRFLEAISFSHGSVLNISEVARECEVSRKTVEGYVDILEDMLLSWRVPVFAKRAKRKLIKQSKFYYFDTGVFRSVRPKGPLDNLNEIDGVALEGLVGQHLKAWCDYTSGHKLYFWRTQSGTEVDFIIYGESVFFACEVKNSNKVFNKDVKALRAFVDDYPECQPVLLYRGKERCYVNGILCIPCDGFLASLKPGTIDV